jgi:hypothetical protein
MKTEGFARETFCRQQGGGGVVNGVGYFYNTTQKTT